MTSSNGNISRVTGPLWGESTGHRWIPPQRPETRSFDVSLICAWTNGWASNRDTGGLRRHCAHYDVTVIAIVIHYFFEVSIKSFYHLSNFPNSCMVYDLNRIIIVYVVSSTTFLDKIFLETYFHIRVILSTAWWCIVFETRRLIYTYLNLLQNIFINKCTKCFSVFVCLKGNAQYSLIKSGAAITRFNIARTCVQHSTAMTKIKHRSRFNIIISTPYLTVTTNFFILH